MNYGRFFELDLNSSRIEEGVSVFNYIDLSDAFSKKEKQMTPEYPIFVTVTSSSVKFILQYCVYKYDNKISSYYPSERINEFSVIHMEEVILELPLKMTSGQSISSIVKRIYSTPFPLQAKGDDINYIEELIKSRYNNGGEKLHYEIRQHARLKERDKRNISYSSLYVWGLYENGKYELFDKSDNNKCNKFLRKIFLDFLFDMMHSDVFKNSVHFDTVYAALLSDYFCASIIRKSEFYYQRAIINNQYNTETGKLDVKAEEIYATYFDNAETEWLECIQASESDKEFENTRQWYKSAKTLPGIREQFKEILLPGFNRHASSWFVAPELELRRVYFNNLEDDTNPDRGKICCSKDFAKCIRKDVVNSAEDLSKRRHRTSLWLFRRYDFVDAFRLATGKRGVNTVLMLMMLLLALSVLLPSCFELLWPVVIKNHKAIVSISLLISFLLFLLKSSNKLGIFSVKELYFKICALHRNLHFLYPRLIASITAAWLTVAFSEDLYKAFFDSHWSGKSIAIIVVLILLFIYYEVDKIVPRVGGFVKLYRSFQLLLTSFIISLAVGIIVINFTGEKILVRSGILPAFYRDNVLLDKKSLDDKLVINLDSQSICEDDCISLVHSYTYGMPIKPSPIEINEMDESGNVVTKFVIPAQPSRKDTLAQLNAFMQVFAGTDYEREYTARIKEARDSVVRMETFEHIHSDSLLLGHFLMRHEDSRMFKDLLDKVVHSDNNQKLATFIEVGNNGYKFFILYDFLIQFAVVAMFIGIFIQMIFEEKNITEL